LLVTGLIACAYAQGVGTQGFATAGPTIERLPPVEYALPKYVPPAPPYGSQFAPNQGSYFVPPAAPIPNPTPGPSVPLPVAEEKAETPPTIEKEEKESEETTKVGDDFYPGILPSPLYFDTTNEELGWVREVRPSSLLVRATRYMSRYVGKWEGSIQFGIDGTSGSSETFNMAFGVNGKRTVELSSFQFDIDYKRSNSDGMITADRLFFTCRYENPYGDGKWHLFVQDEVTYDEFQPWNVQVAVSSGVGYYFWNDDRTKLQGLWGGGFSQDIGGLSEEEYVPEVHFGLTGEHQFNKFQKLIASCNYYPDATDFNKSRIINKASWEVLLDEEVNLSMKFNITDRMYTPNPGGKQNDLDYSMLLMWKF
jgi:hypothetical protein